MRANTSVRYCIYKITQKYLTCQKLKQSFIKSYFWFVKQNDVVLKLMLIIIII